MILSKGDRSGKQADLLGAGSGYGGGDSVTYCPEGVPVEAALLAILGAFAASFGVLFTTITMITGRRRKKKRQIPITDETLSSGFSDALWLGMICNKKLIQLFSSVYFIICIYFKT